MKPGIAETRVDMETHRSSHEAMGAAEGDQNGNTWGHRVDEVDTCAAKSVTNQSQPVPGRSQKEKRYAMERAKF